jgi:hypothetical protein
LVLDGDASSGFVFKSPSYHHQGFPQNCQLEFESDIEQVLREKKPFILRCMLDGIKKRQGGLSNGPDSR